MSEADGRVNPAEHKGKDRGLLSLLFRLKRHRRDDDITAPRPIDPEEQEDDC